MYTYEYKWFSGVYGVGWGEWVGVPISPGHLKNYGPPVYGGELMEGFCPDGGGGLWCGGIAKN